MKKSKKKSKLKHKNLIVGAVLVAVGLGAGLFIGKSGVSHDKRVPASKRAR